MRVVINVGEEGRWWGILPGVHVVNGNGTCFISKILLNKSGIFRWGLDRVGVIARRMRVISIDCMGMEVIDKEIRMYIFESAEEKLWKVSKRKSNFYFMILYISRTDIPEGNLRQFIFLLLLLDLIHNIIQILYFACIVIIYLWFCQLLQHEWLLVVLHFQRQLPHQLIYFFKFILLLITAQPCVRNFL